MKYVILALALAFSTATFAGEPETKKVCHETKDAKTNKTKQDCKTIKVHKKLEATNISDAKKAK